MFNGKLFLQLQTIRQMFNSKRFLPETQPWLSWINEKSLKKTLQKCPMCKFKHEKTEPKNLPKDFDKRIVFYLTNDLVKGSDRQCLVVELRLYYWEFFRIHLRRFNGADVFSKSTNAFFKILIDCPFLRDDFENRFCLNYSKTTTKNVTNNSLANYLLVQKQVEKKKKK